MAVINRNDTAQVWMGSNTAGFALVSSETPDQAADSMSAEGVLMKQALGWCGRVADFERLLKMTTDSGRVIDANFACIDAFGSAALFETGERQFSKLSPLDTTLDRTGFLVRANFTMTGTGQRASGGWCYQRAHDLIGQRAALRQVDLPYLLQNVARDLVSDEWDPYPLPSKGRIDGAPEGYIPTNNTLNKHQTVSCAVFHGVKPGEDPRLTTFWVILGEPMCGVALPLWPASGEIPEALDGEKGSRLNHLIQLQENRFYPKKSWPGYLATRQFFSGRKDWFSFVLGFETEFFTKTSAALQNWRINRPDPEAMARLQYQFCQNLLRAL
jgi:hypothetical protein